MILYIEGGFFGDDDFSAVVKAEDVETAIGKVKEFYEAKNGRKIQNIWQASRIKIIADDDKTDLIE